MLNARQASTRTKKSDFYGEAPCLELLVYDKVYYTPDWLHKGIMYHIFVDRFNRVGDVAVREDQVARYDWGNVPEYNYSNARTACNDFFGGNLRGIIQKLDYLKWLNVKVIYLSPIFRAYSNHKYDTEDYESVDPSFGNEADFVELCKKADKLGMKIILDGVFNHTGWGSRYFNRFNKYCDLGAYQSKDSPYFDWYAFTDFDKRKYKSWWGIEGLPSHNADSISLQNYLTGESGIVAKWLRLGASGWRLDVVDEINDNMLDKIVMRAKHTKSDAAVIGEVWEDATTKSAYGVRRRYFQGAQLDSVMNYPLKNAIIGYARGGDSNLLARVMFDLINNYPKFALDNLMNLLDTHDTERALTALNGEQLGGSPKNLLATTHMSATEYSYAVKLLKIASLLQYTLIGFPSLFYGTEAGLDGYGDPFCRRCYPWGNENKELMAHYQMLGRLRDLPALDGGEFRQLVCARGLYAYERTNGDSSLIVVVNRGQKAKIALDGKYVDFASGATVGNSVEVDCDGFRILVKQEL